MNTSTSGFVTPEESGFVTPEDFSVNSSFTEVTEMYSGAYCILYKAKRYGQWYVLKTLKEEHRSTMLYRELLKKEFDINRLGECSRCRGVYHNGVHRRSAF